MEEERLACIIGQNITRLRKISKMTQLELAEKINYSDKSISKWEQGNGIPDVRILVQLAELFNVSVDDLVREHREKPVVPKKERRVKRILITLLSAGLCWLVAVVCFVLTGIIVPNLVAYAWLAFVYAVPASAVVLLVFSCVWHWRLVRAISISVIIWTVLACVYLTAYICGLNIWLVFIVGAVLQVLALLYFLLWRRSRKLKD